MSRIARALFAIVSAFALAGAPVWAQSPWPSPTLANYAKSVASLAELRSLTHALVTGAPYVTRTGFYAAGDAPPLKYTWFQTCPGTPDNVAKYVSLNEIGGGCFSAANDTNIDDTRNWGVVNGSTATLCAGSDSGNAAALQLAVDTLGQGHTLRQAGWACLINTVTISQSSEGIICTGMEGGSGVHNIGFDFGGPSGFIGGAAGITLFKFKSATTTAIENNVLHCRLNGNSTGTAAIGVNTLSTRYGSWRIGGTHFTKSIIQADIDTTLGEPAGSSGNEYWIWFSQYLANDGSAYICNGTADWDCSQDIFYTVGGVYAGRTDVMQFNGADSEFLFSVSGYNNQLFGNACLIKLSAANNIDSARNNKIDLVSLAAPATAVCTVYAEGTENGKTQPSYGNVITFYDSISPGPREPTVGTGATLYWSTNNAPIGMNYFTQNGANGSWRTSGGIITNYGNSSSIPGGGSQAITFTANYAASPSPGAQLHFPTRCLTWTALPTANVDSHSVCLVSGATTTLTIFNDGASASFFNYTATGN